MKLPPHRTTVSGNAGILFPGLECWNAMTKVATIAADVNKSRVLCRISLDALRDKFGPSKEEPMRFVALRRTAIHEAAVKLIEREIYEEDGSILINSCDL